MNVKVSLGLPSEALSISMIRRVLGELLQTLGVADACVNDLQVAVSEACTNVLDHAGPGEAYEAVVVIEGNVCVLTVLDQGSGFDVADAGDLDDPGQAEVPTDVEHGRGIPLMHALVDDVVFDRNPDGGTALSLRKKLSWQHDTASVPAVAVGT